jgi:hypothetical protein
MLFMMKTTSPYWCQYTAQVGMHAENSRSTLMPGHMSVSYSMESYHRWGFRYQLMTSFLKMIGEPLTI